MCTAQSTFRVSSANDSARSHILQANDELDKRHWLQCIDEALSREVLPITSARLCRHSSDASTSGKLSAEFRSPGSSRAECLSADGSEANFESSADIALDMLPPLAPFTSSSLHVSKHVLEEL